MPRSQPRTARLALLIFALLLAPSVLAPELLIAAELPSRSLVAYLDRSNNLWLSEDNGDNARQVTSNGGVDQIAWSADGTRIAMTGPAGTGTEVLVASSDPSFGLRSLGSGERPVWSPDSSRLALIQGGAIQVFDREMTYIRGTNVGASALRWSPDSRRIGYSRVLSDPYQSGCEVRELGWFDSVSGAGGSVGRSIGKFAWAGDGKRLIYVSSDDGAIRGFDIATGTSHILSRRLANPCGGPFFTDTDGEYLFFLDYGAGGKDLVVLNLDNLQERVYTGVPIGYPAQTLPESYLTVDVAGRFVYAVQTYPTTVTRIDLSSGAQTTLLSDDHRMFLGFSKDHQRLALIDAPFGKPSVTFVRDLSSGAEASFENVGWLSWQSSPVTPNSALAWDRVWDREDLPVAAGIAQRTWIWGPAPFATLEEPYDDSPAGRRAVRYYDKSRMEINVPYADQTSRWYVTNGLLARELITGQLQVGSARYLDRSPAAVPVAGDPDDTSGPTYAALRGVLGVPATATDSELRTSIDRSGTIGQAGPGGVFATHHVGETNHTVADVFWSYLNSRGLIWNGSTFQDGQLFDPTFFATGYPITEAYWTRVKVGGQVKDVLLQCFERRCLTYTPDNPDGWKVEMGNVGQHYYRWRYSG